jgi:hypothetical protein
LFTDQGGIIEWLNLLSVNVGKTGLMPKELPVSKGLVDVKGRRLVIWVKDRIAEVAFSDRCKIRFDAKGVTDVHLVDVKGVQLLIKTKDRTAEVVVGELCSKHLASKGADVVEGSRS